MWQSFLLLFSEMSVIVYIFFIVGIILCCIETMLPGFGFFGISGIICIAIAIIIRMIQGGDVYMLLYMILIAVLIIVLMLTLVGRSLSKGRLGKSKMFDVGTAVPEGRTDATADYSALLNKTGIVVTQLHPIGTAQFGDLMLDVMSKSGIIDEGQKIKIVDVSGQNPLVVKVQ